jgi:IS1 family transposase
MEFRKETYKLGRVWTLDNYDPEKEEEYAAGTLRYDQSAAVEIDESLITHLIDSTCEEKVTKQQWVMGILDRGTGEMRAFCVPDRNASTLLEIINANVELDPSNPCRIYTDGWMAYSQLSDIGYDHRCVNHYRTFGYGSETTNHIESKWFEIKRTGIFNKGFSTEKAELVQIKINEVLWRLENKNLDQRLGNFVDILRRHNLKIFE